MPLIQYDSLDLVPEGLREYAKEVTGTDGKVNVNVVPQVKIDEFRDNNIKLSKERDDLRLALEPLKKIVGDNPEDFEKTLAELNQTAQRVKDGDLKETRSIEEALSKRTEELRKSYEDRLKAEGLEKGAWRQKHDVLDQRYKQTLVASAIKDAAMEGDSGVEPRAIGDITRAALGVFKSDDQGRITPYEGDAPIYGTDGTTPMTPREWIAKLKEEKPFFFKQTNGGGAGGAGQEKKGPLGRTQEQMKGMKASELLALANGDYQKRKTA